MSSTIKRTLGEAGGGSGRDASRHSLSLPVAPARRCQDHEQTNSGGEAEANHLAEAGGAPLKGRNQPGRHAHRQQQAGGAIDSGKCRPERRNKRKRPQDPRCHLSTPRTPHRTTRDRTSAEHNENQKID